jgi:hypothetical protein
MGLAMVAAALGAPLEVERTEGDDDRPELSPDLTGPVR